MLVIECKIKNSQEPVLLKKTQKFFKKHFPLLDYTSVFSITEKSANVAIGDYEFFNLEGNETLEEGSEEYQEADLENQINCLSGYKALKSEDLAKTGIIDFYIDDGRQFGYRPTLQEAIKELERLNKEFFSV